MSSEHEDWNESEENCSSIDNGLWEWSIFCEVSSLYCHSVWISCWVQDSAAGSVCNSIVVSNCNHLCSWCWAKGIIASLLGTCLEFTRAAIAWVIFTEGYSHWHSTLWSSLTTLWSISSHLSTLTTLASLLTAWSRWSRSTWSSVHWWHSSSIGSICSIHWWHSSSISTHISTLSTHSTFSATHTIHWFHFEWRISRGGSWLGWVLSLCCLWSWCCSWSFRCEIICWRKFNCFNFKTTCWWWCELWDSARWLDFVEACLSSSHICGNTLWLSSSS